MISSVAKWGNSLAVRLPKQLVAAVHVDIGTKSKISVQKDRIILERSAYSLDQIIAGITPENCHTETFIDRPTGNEVW